MAASTATPMTVGELIERLKSVDVSAVIMIECDDYHYSGPLITEEIESGAAVKVAPFEWKTPKEDAYGKPAVQKTMQHPGGWFKEVPIVRDGVTVLEVRTCVFIRVDG